MNSRRRSGYFSSVPSGGSVGSFWCSECCHRSSIRWRHRFEIHHNGTFSALSARLTAVASNARARSIGSGSPVSSAKSKCAKARHIVVLRMVDSASSTSGSSSRSKSATCSSPWASSSNHSRTKPRS